MISFQLQDMSCNHCIDTISEALKAVDAAIKLRFDVAAHRVDIESGRADVAELSAAIRAAGYTPVRVDGSSGSGGPGIAAPRNECCCR